MYQTRMFELRGNYMNYWLLIGILIIVVGFILKFDPIAVVVVSAIVTGLIAGINVIDIIAILGKEFTNARLMSLFFLTLPVVAISERYGLRERAVYLIGQMKVVTPGRILSLYLWIRQIAAAFSLRLGGHAQFIRPLIEPMAQGAASAEGEVSEALVEEIKGAAAAVENYGNFYGQNLFYASSGVLLIVQTFEKIHPITGAQIAFWSIPIAVIVAFMGFIQFQLLDRKIKKGVQNNG